ncbi:hypothetical protein Drorol1_Dr00024959 [Drosera rotundifolia]
MNQHFSSTSVFEPVPTPHHEQKSNGFALDPRSRVHLFSTLSSLVSLSISVEVKGKALPDQEVTLDIVRREVKGKALPDQEVTLDIVRREVKGKALPDQEVTLDIIRREVKGKAVLHFNLTDSGLVCVLPWLTMAVSANFGGWIADSLVSRAVSITRVRKILQTVGFLGPAFFLTRLSHVDSPAMAVLCMACSQGTDAFSQSGLYSNHQGNCASLFFLLGLSNTTRVLVGVMGTSATGYILQHDSWDNVFEVSVGLYLVGTVVWNSFEPGRRFWSDSHAQNIVYILQAWQRLIS